VLCAEGRGVRNGVVKENWNFVLKTKLRGGECALRLTQGNKQHTEHTHTRARRGGGGAMRRFEGVGFEAEKLFKNSQAPRVPVPGKSE
jgi:hypothetical protein